MDLFPAVLGSCALRGSTSSRNLAKRFKSECDGQEIRVAIREALITALTAGLAMPLLGRELVYRPSRAPLLLPA